jgi:hypothetical protein
MMQLKLEFPEEEWRPIPIVTWEGYEISNLGNLRRKGRMLHPSKGKRGYYVLNFRQKGRETKFLVHRLVSATFLGPCPLGLEVNHLDGNKLNNCSSNLEYTTRSKNIKHAVSLGLKRRLRGKSNGKTKLEELDIPIIRRLLAEGIPPAEIARMFGVTHGAIGSIKAGRSWTHV